MIWNDTVLNLNLTNEELVELLANIFNVKTEQVVVSDSLESVSEFLLVTCIRNSVKGDFNSILHFYLDFKPKDSIAYLKKLSRSIDSDILTSDELTSDPYQMLRIKIDGSVDAVTVVADKLDGKDEYYIDNEIIL